MKVSRDLFLEFWDSSIFREELKLETSHLACRLATMVVLSKKCKFRSKGVVNGSRDLLL